MKKYIVDAKKYLDTQKHTYPIEFKKINNNSSTILVISLVSQILTGLLFGWLLNWLLFSAFGMTPFFGVDKSLVIIIISSYFLIGGSLGGLFIYYSSKLTNLMTEEDSVLFLGKVFAFSHFFGFGLFWLSFAYNLFGV